MSQVSTVSGGVTTVTTPSTQFVGQDVLIASAAGTVGFFGTTPVAQQTATDLATVIALLKAYGLSK